MSIRNPSEKNCFNPCSACHRCSDKGKWESCASCSGRRDPARRIYPDPDDTCACKEGVLRWKTQKGQLIVTRYPGDPFGGKVQTEKATSDEEQYNQYVKEQRERLDDEHWDPVQFSDGSSTNAWMDKYKRGY